mmetsp:Transcript_19410/g.33018  ORF Transcript_19410/g.33018 Transcript_19410/m.33018 type:complete len:92 (+) Transcript_19410:880-1155(+)
MGYEAGEVKTNLNKGDGSMLSKISAERSATSSFRDLGLYSITRGALRHEIQTLQMEVLPLQMLNSFFFPLSKVMMEMKRKESEEAAQKKQK